MIQIYTGNGKGKTTAAIGLAIRAAGAGKKVFFGQFVKGMVYNEITLIHDQIPQIDHELFGRQCFINRNPEPADYEAAKRGFEKTQEVIKSGKYQLIILDELNIALYYKLLQTVDILSLLKNIPSDVEVVITGRYAPPELIEKADLVTEMKEIKHYFQMNIKAREGIEF